MNEKYPGEEHFSRSFYTQTLRKLLLKPGDFFGELPEAPGFKRPFLFLLTSGFILAALRTPFVPGGSIPMALIILVNALAMPFVSAWIGLGIITLIMRRRGAWSRIFAVYAYASGITYLISWLPLASWIGEPWKWILIGIGLVRSFGLTRGQAVGVVSGSVLAIILLFYLLSSAFMPLKG
jgi:hypothetical protein